MYINAFTKTPPGVMIIPQNVTYVCNKNAFEFARIIQGFKDGRPNGIGYAIF